MKIKFEKYDLDELLVVFRGKERTKEIDDLMSLLDVAERKVSGYVDDVRHLVSAKDILYIESSERKIFFYTSDEIYRSTKNLSQLGSELAKCGFVQINKSTIMNIDKVKRLKMLPNSKIEMTLIGGEKLEVSRTYMPIMKKVLKEKL